MLRYLLAALLLAGCAGPDGKDANSAANNDAPNSSTNNAGTNNGGSNNGGSNNVLNNGATNTRPNNVTATNNASTNNNTRPNTTVPGCVGRADCGVDQECVDGACADHAVCEGGLYEPGDGGCRTTWTGCDGSDFEFACVREGDWFCTCVQDGAVGRTATFVDEPCSEAGIHYAANAACGWVVPSVTGR